MPRIIDYSTPQRGVNYAEQRSDRIMTGNEGRDLQQLGRGITYLASNVGDAIQKRQLQKDNTKIHLDNAQTDLEFQTRIDEEVRAGTLDVDKLSNDLTDRFNEQTQGIETGQGRDALAMRQATLKSQILQHATHSKSVLDGIQSSEKIQQWWNVKGNALQKNPSAFKDALAAQADFVETLKRDHNMSADQASKMLRMGSDDMAKNSIQGYLDQNNPYLVKKLLKDGTYDDYLSSENRTTMMNRAQAQIDAAQARVKNIEGYRIKDPYKFLQENGIAPPTLNLTDPKSIEARYNFIQETGKKFGYHKGEIPLMTTLEARDWSRSFDKLDSASAAGELQNIAIKMPEQMYSAFSKQIFEERPGLGVAMEHARNGIGVSEKIIAGNQLLTDAKGKGIGTLDPPSKSKIELIYNDQMGNAIHDSATNSALMDAAYSHYTKTMFDKNGDASVLDESVFRESMLAVAGPTGTVNGSKIVSFMDEKGKFVEADVLENEFENLDIETIKKTQKDVPRNIGKEPVNISKERARIVPIPSGDGKYYLRRGDDLFIDKDGQKYELDMKSYLKESKTKNNQGFIDSISNFFKKTIKEPVFNEAKAGQ